MSIGIFKLSKEQEAAVDIAKNIAVSAGAGSGKTRVLTNRYLKLLESGIEIQEIAAITFTEKAALEMKERIRKAINAKISSVDSRDKINWMRHLDKLNIANISTIHGFCSNIVKENAAFLGVDFNFSIINNIDKAMILAEASQNVVKSFAATDEYRDTVEKFKNAFGEEYLYKAFLEEAIKLRVSILEEGKNIKELCDNALENSVEKFCLSVVKEIEKYYSDYKLKNDLLDYNDLENMTLQILHIKSLRERYRSRYKTLLVDEFQDTNEIQKRIIYKIAADDEENLIPKKLFIVGDFKQSIYGFRGTDYTIFKKVSEDIGEEGQKPLSTCYRSKNEIISGINSIFSKLIDNYEPLKSPDNNEIKEKRIKILTYPKVKNSSNNILTEVKKMLQGKNSTSFESLEKAFNELKDSYNLIPVKENKDGIAVMKAIKFLRDKNLEFKDICILVRSRSVISDIEDELIKRKVPYCIIGGVGFYQKTEVDEILNLYKVIVRGFTGEFTNEENRNFIKALRGTLFQIPDNILLQTKIERDESSCENLYKALKIVTDGIGDDKNKTKLLNTYTILDKLEQLKERFSVVQIIRAIMKECRVFETMLAQNNGIQKFRNVEKLLYEAEKFDKEQLFTLEQFVDYIMLLDENSMEDSEAALDTEDSEAVKIMTIHQSKGLEFKGVIMPKIQSDLLSISKKNKPNVIYHKNSIILSKNLDNMDEINLNYEQCRNSKLIKEIDEYIRLLYVAMTRAMDYVVLTGGDDGKDPSSISEAIGKIEQLNTFIKQLKYALNVKNADKSCIEFIDIDTMEDLETIKAELKDIEIDKEHMNKRLNYKCNIKNNAMVSATRYMKYLKCPRRFYLESVLNVNGKDYIEQELAEDTTENINLKSNNSISADLLGIIVHSIIESLNSDTYLSEEEVIKAAIDKYGLAYIDGIEQKLTHYLQGYNILEQGKDGYGNLVYKSNELEYSLSPLEDRKTSIAGFIDRLEVFKKDNKVTAVITDYKTNYISESHRVEELTQIYELQMLLYGKAMKELLYINSHKVQDVILQLYFLDIPKKVQIPYDENKVEEHIKNMDCIFGRNLSTCSSKDFPRESSKECDKCHYNGVCNV